MLTQMERWRKLLATVAFCLGSIALMFTLSRGGWTAFVLSLAIFGLAAWQRGWISPKALLIVASTGLLLVLFFGEAISIRLLGDDRGAAYARIPLMRIAWRMIHYHPILGVGANNPVLYLPQYVTPEFSREWIYLFHNKYLIIWSEAGIGALVAFVAFFIATIYRGWQVWRLNDRLLSPLALGFTAAIIGQMAHMLVDTFQGRPTIQMQWLVAGLIAAMSDIVTSARQIEK